jgi:hypothetical protein
VAGILAVEELQRFDRVESLDADAVSSGPRNLNGG